MPDAKNVEETTEQEQKTQPPTVSKPARTSSVPILLSSLALLLAVFALAATLINSKNMRAQQPLNDIKGQLSAMESRVNHVETLMATDKHGLVQAELQKMLLNLHELSRLGDNETRAEISKAEAILLRLSMPATRVKAKVDLKTTEQGMRPKKKAPVTAPVSPEAVKKPLTQNPQTTQTSKTAPDEHIIKSKSEPKAESKPAEKPLGRAANASLSDTEADTMPVSPTPMEK